MRRTIVTLSMSIWLLGCASERSRAPAVSQPDGPARASTNVPDTSVWSSIESLENDTAISRAIASGDFSDRLGVLQRTRHGTVCLTIADSTLPPGTPLIVVSPEDSQPPLRAAIAARRTAECINAGDEAGSVVMKQASFYDVVLPAGASDFDRGIAIAARPGALRDANGVASIDIDGDGHPESFTSCTSNEGTHLIVNTLIGRDTTKRWEAYIYVPYDLEPTCGK